MITGARGWIGGHVVRRLAGQGLTPMCVGHNDPFEIIAKAAAAADVIVHAGGVYSNSRSEFVSGNIEQAVGVAQGCSQSGATVIFLSSVKVYGWAEMQGQAADEAARTPAADNFSAAKLLVEDLFGRAAQRSVVLRIANVYGRKVPDKYAIGTMLATTRREGRVVLECAGESRRDFVHLDDVVGVIERSVFASLPGSESDSRALTAGRNIFNVASGIPVTLAEVARLFYEELGATVELRGGHEFSSPTFPNRKAIESGLIDSFRNPIDGVRTLLRDWRSNPWDPS